MIKKTCHAYKALKASIRAGNLGEAGSKRRAKAESKPIRFRPDAAQPFDDRCLSWQLGTRTVSIWTTSGRLRGIRFACSAAALETLAAWPGRASRTWCAGRRGGGGGGGGRQLSLRRKLQAKGAKSAKRLLRKRARKEARFARDANHCIAKKIVTEAERTCRGIALEDLGGIRERARLRKPQRVTLNSWSFAQLGSFIAYTGALGAGVPVVHVDPAYASQRCAECGHLTRRTVFHRPRSPAGAAVSLRTRTGTLPATSPPAAGLRGTRGVSHARLPLPVTGRGWTRQPASPPVMP